LRQARNGGAGWAGSGLVGLPVGFAAGEDVAAGELVAFALATGVNPNTVTNASMRIDTTAGDDLCLDRRLRLFPKVVVLYGRNELMAWFSDSCVEH
jgi:hypothetical protein